MGDFPNLLFSPLALLQLFLEPCCCRSVELWLTTFSVSCILRNADGEGKFVSLLRLTLDSLLSDLAELNPLELEVLFPSPRLIGLFVMAMLVFPILNLSITDCFPCSCPSPGLGPPVAVLAVAGTGMLVCLAGDGGTRHEDPLLVFVGVADM